MQEDQDRLPKKAREMMVRLAEEAAQMRKYRSTPQRDRFRQTSLPQLRAKKVEIKSDPLKKLVEKSKQDFFSRRESNHQRLRSSSRRREEPLARQFESEVERIMKSEQRATMKQSRISTKLQELLGDEQPNLHANLREIEQYNLEKSKGLKKSRLIEINVDLAKLSASRMTMERMNLVASNEPKVFKLPLMPPDQVPRVNFATYHTKEGDVSMACETVEEKEDRVRIRFVNGFEKWIKKPTMPRIISEDTAGELNTSIVAAEPKENIMVSERLLKPILKKVRETIRSEYVPYLEEELRSNYVMSMTHFQMLHREGRIYQLFGNRPKEVTTRSNGFRQKRSHIEKVLLGSEDLNFVKEFTLDKTKYFPYIVECYVSLQKILEFPHFQSFLTSFRDQIAEGSLTDKYLHELFRIEQYFFQKKQEFEMLVYEVETTVTLLVSEVRNDLQNKISANSRLESLQYQDRLTLLSKNLTTRMNILIKSHALQGIIVGLRELAAFYRQNWLSSTIVNPNLPRCQVYDWCCQLPHPHKYKPLIEVKLEYRRLKKMKKANIYRHLLELRKNVREARCYEEARVYCSPLQELEEEFERKFTWYLQELSSMENVNGCTNSTVVGFDFQDTSITGYRRDIRSRIGRSYDRVTTICGVFSNFELYLADRSYVDELLELFERINGAGLVRDELNYLREDKKLVENLPNSIYCDMLVVQTTDLKERILNAIDSNRNKIIRSCENRLSKIYERSQMQLLSIESRIQSASGNLDLFLSFYEFFKDRSIESSTNVIVEEMLAIGTLYDILVEACARIPPETTRHYLNCQDWLRRMQNARSEAKRKLAAASELFLSTIKQTKLKIFTRLQKMIKDLLEVSKFTEPTNYRRNSAMCKNIHEELRELAETADGILEKEAIFGLPLSDFSIFHKEKQQFEKYVRLWDFIEKFKDKQTMKKLTVANFNVQDLLTLSREGLEVTYFVKRNTVNKRFLTLTDEVRKEMATLLEKLPLLVLVLNPSFSETEWLGLFKEVFPEQEKFPPFYEMTIYDFEKTGILDHPKQIYEHYRLVRSEYDLLNHLNFFEFALKHLDFGYRLVEDMDLLVVSDQTLETVARLKDHYTYLLTVYYKNGKLEGMTAFLKTLYKALLEVRQLAQLIPQLNCILKWYVANYLPDEYPALRDSLAVVADQLTKKTDSIRKFTVFYLYEERSKLSFADGLKGLLQIRAAIFDRLEPLKERYAFLRWLDNSHIYELLSATDSATTINILLRRYLLKEIKHLSLTVNDSQVKLLRLATYHDEEIEFEKTFNKVEKAQVGLSMGIFDIYEEIKKGVARAIKSETLTALRRLHCHQLDVATIYEYYVSSHAPLQSVLLAMLLQFNMTLLCICESRSDLKDYRMWLTDRMISKTIPAEPIRKSALDTFLSLMAYFLRVLTYIETNCGPRTTSYEFVALPKLLPFRNKPATLSKKFINEQAQWTSTVKAGIEDDTTLFSLAHQSPVYRYLNLDLLDKYTHQSQLGSDQRKLLQLNSLVDYGDLSFGLEAFGWIVEYGFQLANLTLPTLAQHKTLSETVVCCANRKVLLTSSTVNEFLLGRSVMSVDPSALLNREGSSTLMSMCQSKSLLIKVRLDREQLAAIVKISRFGEQLQACLALECAKLECNILTHLPQEVTSCYRIVENGSKQIHQATPQRTWTIKGVPSTSPHSQEEADRVRNSFAEALRQHYLSTGVAWHSGLQLNCLNRDVFAADSTITIRALAVIHYLARFTKPFNVFFIPLYQLTSQELFGCFVSQTYEKITEKKQSVTVKKQLWQRGIIERLLEDIERYCSTEVVDSHYLSTYHSELSGKQTDKERAQTLQDWFVLDLSLWQPNNPAFLRTLDWVVGCIRCNCFTFGSGSSFPVRLEAFKLVLKLPGTQHMPPSAVSIPCAFSQRNVSTVNVDRQMAQWKLHVNILNEEFTPYSQEIVELSLLIFTQTKPLFEGDYSQYTRTTALSFQQMFTTFTRLLSIGLNEFRKFMLAQGFYNYTDLTEEEKKNIVSPIDLRGVSTIKDDIEELHEISKQEKDLDACRRILFKDLSAFVTAAANQQAQEEAKLSSKGSLRMLYCLQSITAFSFYWSFCGLILSKHTPLESSIIAKLITALEKHSSKHTTDQFAFNLRQLHSLHGSALDLRKFAYSLQRECWLTWREVALPAVESVSSSFRDRILEPAEIVRLSPHAGSIDYISNSIEHLSDGNTCFIFKANSYSSAATEYLTKMFLAYAMPVQLISEKNYQRSCFSAFLKQHLLSYSPNRVVTLTEVGCNDPTEYLIGRSHPSLGNRFLKYKGRNDLNGKQERLFVLVEDISLENHSMTIAMKSLIDYSRIRNTPINNCSVLMLGGEKLSTEELGYVRYEDCEAASLLSIYNSVSETFKPNSLEVFNFMCCNVKARRIVDNMRIGGVLKIDVRAGLTFLNQTLHQVSMLRTAPDGQLKQMIQHKIKMEADYYRFLKGEAIKNFGKEEQPFEEERLDRERELLLLEAKIEEGLAGVEPSYAEGIQQKLVVPKYMIDLKPEESPRKEAASPTKRVKLPYNELVMVEDSSELSWVLETAASYLRCHYNSDRERHRIRQHPLPELLENVLFVLGCLEVHGAQRQYLLVHDGNEQYCQFVFRLAAFFRQKAAELSNTGKRVLRAALTDDDIAKKKVVRLKVPDEASTWQQLTEKLAEELFLAVVRDSTPLVILQLEQQGSKFIDFFQQFLQNSIALDLCISASAIDRGVLASKYRGFEGINRAHLIAQLKEKCFFCFIIDRQWTEPAVDHSGWLVKIEFPVTASVIPMIQGSLNDEATTAESIIFTAAYAIYRKYFRRQFVTHASLFRRLLSIGQAEELFTNLSQRLLKLLQSRQTQLLNAEGSFLKSLDSEFSKKLTTINEIISNLELQLSVKRESLLQLEEELRRCSSSISTSESTLIDLKASYEQSEFIRFNSEKQRMGFDGQEFYFAAREQFRQLNRKQLEKEVTRDDFYNCPLMLFYVYWCNILTDSNFFPEKYSELLEGDIEAAPNEEMKKQFVKAVGYGRFFIVVDSDWPDKFSSEQVAMARKLRRRFRLLQQLDERAKQRNTGRVYSHTEKYLLRDEVAPEIALLKQQKLTELQLGFATFMASCFAYKRESFKMQQRITEHRKNMEHTTERLKLVREATSQARIEQQHLQGKIKQLKGKIGEFEEELRVNLANEVLLREVHAQNVAVLKPVFLFESTYAYEDPTTRSYQTLLLSFVVVLTVSGWSDFMVDEMFEFVRTTFPASEQPRIELAIAWIQQKMFIRLLPEEQLRALLEKEGIYNQRCFWNMVYCELLANCGFEDLEYDSSAGIRCGRLWIRMVREHPSPSEVLLYRFERKVAGLFGRVFDRMRDWTVDNSRKYVQILEKIQQSGLKSASIQGLRIAAFEPSLPAFGELLQIDIRPLYKKYEHIEKTLKSFKVDNMEQLLSYTVQICQDNFISLNASSFDTEFLRIFNQIVYEFSSRTRYQLSMTDRWLGDRLTEDIQPTKVFLLQRKPDEHKKLVSDYDRLNDTARKYEVELEELKGSMQSLEVPLLNSRSTLYKRPFSKRFEYMRNAIEHHNEVLNLHEFVKKRDCEIMRITQLQTETVCDVTAANQVAGEKWFDGMVKAALGGKDKQKALPEGSQVGLVERYFPSELMRVIQQAHPWRLINERSGLATVLRLQVPIICIASNGNSLLLQDIQHLLAQEALNLVCVDFSTELEFYQEQLASLAIDQVLAVRFVDSGHFLLSTVVQQLSHQLKTLNALKVLFLMYCCEDIEPVSDLRLAVPIYYVKCPPNIKSEIIRLNHSLYLTCLSNIEIEEDHANIRQHCFLETPPADRVYAMNPSLVWLDSNRTCKFLSLKLQLLFAMLKVRCQALGQRHRQAIWRLQTQLHFIWQLVDTCKVPLPDLICKLTSEPDLEPVVRELAGNANLNADNVIYQLADANEPLIKVLPTFENFLTTVVMLPDQDHHDMLLLPELHQIRRRAHDSKAVMREYRFQQSREKLLPELKALHKNPPLGKTYAEVQSMVRTITEDQQSRAIRQTCSQLSNFFRGLVRNQCVVELPIDLPHNFKQRAGGLRSKLNVNELTRKEVEVEALNQPENYRILFKLMTFVKKILKKRASTGSLVVNNSSTNLRKIVVSIGLKELIGRVLSNEIEVILVQGIFQQQFEVTSSIQLRAKKQAADRGTYLRQLYHHYVTGLLPNSIDCSSLFVPQSVFLTLLSSHAIPNKKPLINFRIVADCKPREDVQSVPITGISLHYAKLDEDMFLVRSSEEYNPLGQLYFSVVEREQPTNDIVVCFSSNISLQVEHRSLKDKKTNAIVQPNDRRVVRVPLVVGTLKGYVYLETKLEPEYTEFNDVLLTCGRL